MSCIKRIAFAICTLFVTCLAIIGLSVLFSQTAFAQNKTVVVFAPHPDDEALCCSGVIYAAKAAGNTVKVVVVTNGDFYGYNTGFTREAETVSAMAALASLSRTLSF